MRRLSAPPVLAALALLAATSAVLLALGHRAAAPGDARQTGTVTGRVFWDQDADGGPDPGEPGLPTTLAVFPADDPSADAPVQARTDENGVFRIDLPRGEYVLRTGTQRRIGLCADGFSTNDPFPGTRCWNAELPVTSPELSEPFTVSAGATTTADLPVTTADRMTLVLRAIEETDYAAADTVITAIIEGRECGSATVPATTGLPAENSFTLYVEGDGSVDGCAEPGDTVQFEMNGKIAAQTVVYEPFAPSQSVNFRISGLELIDLTFSEDWMWLWSDNVVLPDGTEAPVGARMVARIGGAGCGLGVNTAEVFPGSSAGFEKLLVPSNAISRGCGVPGARVDLVAILPDRDVVLESFAWEPGVRRVGADLRLPPSEEDTRTPVATTTAPTATPTPRVGIRPPATGYRDRAGGGTVSRTLAMAVAFASAGATAAAAARVVRR